MVPDSHAMTEPVSTKRRRLSQPEPASDKAAAQAGVSPAGTGGAEIASAEQRPTGENKAPAAAPDTQAKAPVSGAKAEADPVQSAGSAATLPGATRPVFGAASTFGSASIFEKMKNKTNVFETGLQPAKAQDEPLGSATLSFGSFGGSFGASSKFSNALHKATQKRSFLDEPKDEGGAEQGASEPSSQQYKQVELSEKKVETGEENERSVYSTTAKLFELDLSNLAAGWRERGRGPLHVNQALGDPTQVRLVMRSHGLLRVILNYKITAATELIKGLEASLSPGKFLRMTSVSAEGTPIQYMVKFANEETRDALVEKVGALKKEIQLAVGSKAAGSSTPAVTGFRFITDSSEGRTGAKEEGKEEEKDTEEAGVTRAKSGGAAQATLKRTNTDVDPGN